jgi:hypothetical protein
LCSLVKINRFDILGYYSINPVFSGESYMIPLKKGLNHGYYRKIDHGFVLGSPHGGSPTSDSKPLKYMCRGGPVCPPASETFYDISR